MFHHKLIPIEDYSILTQHYSIPIHHIASIFQYYPIPFDYNPIPIHRSAPIRNSSSTISPYYKMLIKLKPSPIPKTIKVIIVI